MSALPPRLLLATTVVQVEQVAAEVRAFWLERAYGGEFPAVEAGAHVDVHWADAAVRCYSLCGAPAERRQWRIAVHAAPGRPGTAPRLHAELRPGVRLYLSQPRSNFPLRESDSPVLLVAGGIGITPLLSMAHVLATQARPFELHYATRSPAHAAFVDELVALLPVGCLYLHVDDAAGRPQLDLRRLFDGAAPGTDVYCCGPAGMIVAAQALAAARPDVSLHVERFGRPAALAAAGLSAGDAAFELELRRSQSRVSVGAGETLLQALRRCGQSVDSACEAGICGACVLPYVEGRVEHRDLHLSPQRRATHLAACVSRAEPGSTLVLDI